MTAAHPSSHAQAKAEIDPIVGPIERLRDFE